MKYHKAGKKTWILSSKPFEAPTKKRVKKPRNKSNKTKEYISFCEKIFKERKVVSIPYFNKRIKEEIHSNFTWYRKRLVDLKLIKIENNVIKPGPKL